jgi:hypothetical protein
MSGDIRIRMTPKEYVDPPKACLDDLVMKVSGHIRHTVSNTVRGIINKNPERWGGLEKYQFPGSGQTPREVVSAKEALQFLMVLRGKAADVIRLEFSGLLSGIFEGDATLKQVIDHNALVGNPLGGLCQFLQDNAPAMDACFERGGESEAHEECKFWVAANINSISFATAVCPQCSVPIIGLGVTGGRPAVEQTIPGTNYRADVLVRLEDNTYVAIEVAHTHLISAKKMFECKQAGNTVYEVETREIKRVMIEHQPFSHHVLYTTCTESVLCSSCAVNAAS